MSLTPTSTGSSSSVDLTRPTSVTVVSSSGTPSSDASWTTSVPRTLYTAPSDCEHVKIYWRKSIESGNSSNYSYASSYFGNTTSSYYYYYMKITNSDNTMSREIFRGTHTGNGFWHFNHFGSVANSSAGNSSPYIRDGDVFVSTGARSFVMDGGIFVLAPGEKLELWTGNNSHTGNYRANFEAWVY